MAAARRGDRPVGAVRLGEHLCLGFGSEEERRAVVGRFVADGLDAGHKVVYLAQDDEPGAVLDALGGDALRRAEENGQFVVRPIVRAYVATDRFDPAETAALLGTEVDLATLQGYGGVRLTGDTAFSLLGWPNEQDGPGGVCRTAFAAPGERAVVLCPYDRRWFTDEQMTILRAGHDAAVRADDLYADRVLRISPTFTPPGLALTGAVDESTLPAVLDALARYAGRPGHFCLDLSGLEFCDLDGLRALLGAGEAGTRPDRQVVLRGLPEPLRAMARLAGWDTIGTALREEPAR
ncbi:MEDS domain-containing protein [Actinomadura flavalba]|uniref:MEDS domain-containing protein n=1 Tax=Actinomadura flavalba TaxID=1120938 RepID=UPI0003766E4A|nr:MEDS domain-containing protein [Actinomadura flavalba]